MLAFLIQNQENPTSPMKTKNLWPGIYAMLVLLVVGAALSYFIPSSPVPVSEEIVAVEQTANTPVFATDMKPDVTQPTPQISEAEQQLRQFGLTLEGATPITVQ
jgi:hypothetical protein